MHALMRFTGFSDVLRGVDSGLNYAHYARLYTSEMFVPLCLPELNIDDADLDSALSETMMETA